MTPCPWEKIDRFRSLAEFEKFNDWMAEQIESGAAEEIAARAEHKSPYWGQRIFRHKASGAEWRLAEPDPPFPGIFEPIK